MEETLAAERTPLQSAVVGEIDTVRKTQAFCCLRTHQKDVGYVVLESQGRATAM